MEVKSITKAITELNKERKQRNFAQSVDIIINLKDIDLKKTENQVEFFTSLPHGYGKDVKLCALVGPELKESAAVFDEVIAVEDFAKVDKKKAKELAGKYKFFIAQANVMPKVAQAFGRVLGPRGKMPNPKAGCVVPPKTNLDALKEKLEKTVKVSAKAKPVIQIAVGTDAMSETQIAENINAVYEQLIHNLPNGENQVSSIFVKYTMSKPVKL